MMKTSARIAALSLFLAATGLAGCVPYQQASLGIGGKAQPYARTWADPSWPRPDQPPDRDGRGKD
ncbi:hypothetical protein [Bosea sp. (in: a-proteobacteria)]|jgi:hypothetical protein|uniref:hypothetical protein n=1 Tax=Bosea sp. (in: a-proteobacteria) TaxID=1871050 RepID=UPI003F7257B7